MSLFKDTCDVVDVCLKLKQNLNLKPFYGYYSLRSVTSNAVAYTAVSVLCFYVFIIYDRNKTAIL